MRKVQVLHTHYLKSATVVLKEVLKVEPNHVVVDDRTIPYDYLVINTGSTYHLCFFGYLIVYVFDTIRYQPPFKESRLIGATRGNTLRESNLTIRKAKKVSSMCCIAIYQVTFTRY